MAQQGQNVQVIDVRVEQSNPPNEVSPIQAQAAKDAAKDAADAAAPALPPSEPIEEGAPD